MPKAPPKLDPADPIHRFALELRRLRIRGGDPSQIKLARAVGCTHSTISAYFNGHRLPGPKQLESLVVACKGNPAQWLEKLEAVHDEIGRIPNSRSPEPDSDSLVTDSHLRPLPSHEYEIETGPTVSARPFGERKIAFDGQEGADVAQLQQHLSRHGFLREKYADGTFDRQTKEALYKFQHDMGIYVDGAPDATTAKVLKFLETLDSRAVDLPDDLRSLVQMVVRSQNMGLIFVGNCSTLQEAASTHEDRRKEILGEASRRLIERLDTHPLLQGIEPPSGYSFKRALQLADSVGSELVIYIDAIESKHIKRGVATFFFGAEGKFSAIGRPLAQCIHDEMAGLAGVDNRGCSSENSVILGKPHAPAVRVELGNLSDRIDRARLGDRQHINQLADAISRGISRLYELNLPDSLQ